MAHCATEAAVVGRIPYGMRGLKSRRAERAALLVAGRIPYGMRGLKYLAAGLRRAHRGRIPYGMRGLKSPRNRHATNRLRSHPIRDAWIEIAARPR